MTPESELAYECRLVEHDLTEEPEVIAPWDPVDPELLFVSHETYTPARGTSSSSTKYGERGSRSTQPRGGSPPTMRARCRRISLTLPSA